MSAENKTLQLIRRDEHMRVGRRAQERGERVASDIEQQHRALADEYNITLEQLHLLLDDPPTWRKFQAMMSSGTEHVESDESPPLNNKRRTQKTSPHSGTVFDTSNWDLGFNPKNRGE